MGNMINLTSPREINRFSLKSHTSPLFQLRWVQLSAGGVPKFCRVWKGWLEGGEFEHNNSYKFKFSGKNMENIITKPRFEKSMKITTMALPDVNLVFSTKRVEPMSFADLRNADYGKGFRMSTMPELVSLIYASFKNQEYETTKNFIKIFKNEWFLPKFFGIIKKYRNYCISQRRRKCRKISKSF
ncbi:MAG: hypothetical protein NTZ83_03535 [Candidatus Pacearchaeota archaeon]|nr:hypothetical protein [Candidatus Pacearchaeota archaeon]